MQVACLFGKWQSMKMIHPFVSQPVDQDVMSQASWDGLKLFKSQLHPPAFSSCPSHPVGCPFQVLKHGNTVFAFIGPFSGTLCERHVLIIVEPRGIPD